MRGSRARAAATIAPLVAEAAARRVRPPVRLVGVDARAWVVVERGPASRAGDALLLDEFGDVWWGRLDGRGSAQVVRACWPEELRSFLGEIGRAVSGALGEPSSQR